MAGTGTRRVGRAGTGVSTGASGLGLVSAAEALRSGAGVVPLELVEVAVTGSSEGLAFSTPDVSGAVTGTEPAPTAEAGSAATPESDDPPPSCKCLRRRGRPLATADDPPRLLLNEAVASAGVAPLCEAGCGSRWADSNSSEESDWLQERNHFKKSVLRTKIVRAKPTHSHRLS
ncbi:MAG: hypothetical protein JO295_07930 [Verrucomicrobia bacterium]|nr:hypothetical protein [Verrucomicrobiota bacterium]